MKTLLALALSFLCVFTACSRSKTVSTPGGKVTVEDTGKNGESNVTITGNNGEQLSFNSAGGKVPDDYPKDVPVVSGAKVLMSASVNNSSSNNGSQLVLETTDGMDKVAAFYKKGLVDNGWKIDTTMTQEKMTLLAASKDKRAFSVNIQEADGKSTVTQTVGNK